MLEQVCACTTVRIRGNQVSHEQYPGCIAGDTSGGIGERSGLPEQCVVPGFVARTKKEPARQVVDLCPASPKLSPTTNRLLLNPLKTRLLRPGSNQDLEHFSDSFMKDCWQAHILCRFFAVQNRHNNMEPLSTWLIQHMFLAVCVQTAL